MRDPASQLPRSFGDQLLEIAVDAPSFLLRATQAEQRVHRGDQFIRLDRLDEIGIGAAIERPGAVGYAGEGGRSLQDDNMPLYDAQISGIICARVSFSPPFREAGRAHRLATPRCLPVGRTIKI